MASSCNPAKHMHSIILYTVEPLLAIAKDTPEIRTLEAVPRMSRIEGFHCIIVYLHMHVIHVHITFHAQVDGMVVP